MLLLHPDYQWDFEVQTVRATCEALIKIKQMNNMPVLHPDWQWDPVTKAITSKTNTFLKLIRKKD